ncbi:hypothetical protein MMC14_002641 [Varicellaria rhodocarpa]|nr:hypothetical protein [Varicellaria rhodocarpa]
MTTPLLYSPSLSLYSIPLAWLLALLPHIYAKRLFQSSTSTPYPNIAPRLLPTHLSTLQNLPQHTKDRILRAEAAQANGLETLGVYAAGVVAMYVVGVEAGMMNALCGGYLVARGAYNAVYVWADKEERVGWRTAVWCVGVGFNVGMWVVAGNRAGGDAQ